MSSKPMRVKEHVISAMEIPRDLAYREALITVTGNTCLCIENYKSIQEYTTSRILVLTKNGRVQVSGSSLEIRSYTNDEMLIAGHITEIVFLN